MRVALLLTVTTLALPSLAQTPERRSGSRDRSPKALENFTFKEEKFRSEAVGQEVPFGIYLPKGYDDDANKETRWPLVIWLHGMWEDHLRFHGRGGAPLLDQAVGDGKLPPCVFVCANGGRTSMYINRKDQRWEDLITVDLLAHLTKNYHTSERPQQRALMGVSMGGMAALRIAFQKPELFGAVAAHSAAVFAEDPDKLPERMKGMAKRLGLEEEFGNPIQKEPWQKANPLCIAATADPKSLAALRIYFDAGTADRMGLHAGNKLLHEKLEERNVRHTWRLIEGGGHSWGDEFQGETLPHSFAFIGQVFAEAQGTKAKDTVDKGKNGSPAPNGKQ
jgi:S-formylglutathione hydrolase